MDLQKSPIRFERIIAVVLFVGLISVYINKVLGVAELSERMMIESHTTQLKAALDLRFAELMMTSEQSSARALEGTNPMRLYERLFPRQAFEGYLGEQWDVQFETLDEGSWIFDKKTRVLLYKLINEDVVTNLDPEPSRLQWRIIANVIEENKLQGNGKRQRVESLQLESVYAFEWNY